MHSTDCNGNDWPEDVTTQSTWSSSIPSVANVNSTGFATALDGGSTAIGATYSDFTYTWSPALRECFEHPRTLSDSAACSVQRPSYVSWYGSATDSVTCPGPSGFSARRLSVQYQVLDSSQSPINRAGMTVSEQLSWVSDQCITSDQCGQRPTASGWTTGTNGIITEPDQIYNCSATCTGGGQCTEAWEQTFKVNGASVGIVNGPVTGTRNCISTDCTHTPSGNTR